MIDQAALDRAVRQTCPDLLRLLRRHPALLPHLARSPLLRSARRAIVKAYHKERAA